MTHALTADRLIIFDISYFACNEGCLVASDLFIWCVRGQRPLNGHQNKTIPEYVDIAFIHVQVWHRDHMAWLIWKCSNNYYYYRSEKIVFFFRSHCQNYQLTSFHMSQMVPVDVNRIAHAADVAHIEVNFDDSIDSWRSLFVICSNKSFLFLVYSNSKLEHSIEKRSWPKN